MLLPKPKWQNPEPGRASGKKNIRGFVDRLQASKLKLHQWDQSPHPNFRLSAIIASQVGLEMFGSAEN